MFLTFRRKKINYKNELIELIHFIKTPLTSIKIGDGILKDIIPLLIDIYKKQKINKEALSVNDKKINKLIFIIDNIYAEANRISKYIENIEIK